MGLEPASGISSFTGYRGGEPLRTGISFTDPYSGIIGAGAVLAALHYRRRTGKGQYIDLSEQEAAITVSGYSLMDQALNHREPERIGNRSPWFAPQGCYRCRGEDRWVVLTVRTDAEWRAFCDAVGHSEWAEDERFADVLGRRRHHDELDELIASWTREQDHIEAMHLLQRAGVIAAAVLNPKQVLLDPHLRERGYFATAEFAGGLCPVPKALGARFQAFEAGPRGSGPKLGEHNQEVLQGLLGLSDEEMAELQEAGAIGDTPDFSPLPVEALRAFVQWPLTSLHQMGALAAVESDYRKQLGIG
jgi:crotonobetainyl-CoA:carnitine CoA-transferase CaiB-like acyl-CoA transferase